jgi:cyclase
MVGELFFVRARHRRIVMYWNITSMIAVIFLIMARPGGAQDLGNYFVKIGGGIYIYARDAASNCGIIVTQEGVVLIDSGPNPPDSLLILKAIKQLTPLPIRFLINTETHNDHTTGNFVFSPPAVVIAAAGATEGIKSYYSVKRNEKLMAESAEMRESFRGFRLVTPHIEFHDRMMLNMGDRIVELIQLKNIHSEADTAIWLPKERILFSAATAAVKRFGFLRPFVTIDNVKADIKKLKALDPIVVVPAHGLPGTVQLLDETEQFYDVLLDRVGKMIADGKSLADIKKDLRLSEYQSWSGGKERLETNIEAAYRALKK